MIGDAVCLLVFYFSFVCFCLFDLFHKSVLSHHGHDHQDSRYAARVYLDSTSLFRTRFASSSAGLISL